MNFNNAVPDRPLPPPERRQAFLDMGRMHLNAMRDLHAAVPSKINEQRLANLVAYVEWAQSQVCAPAKAA